MQTCSSGFYTKLYLSKCCCNVLQRSLFAKLLREIRHKALLYLLKCCNNFSNKALLAEVLQQLLHKLYLQKYCNNSSPKLYLQKCCTEIASIWTVFSVQSPLKRKISLRLVFNIHRCFLWEYTFSYAITPASLSWRWHYTSQLIFKTYPPAFYIFELQNILKSNSFKTKWCFKILIYCTVYSILVQR